MIMKEENEDKKHSNAHNSHHRLSEQNKNINEEDNLNCGGNTIGDICRLCENSLKVETFRSAMVNHNEKTKLLNKKLFPIINRDIVGESIEHFDICENEVIFPCNCLIPVHAKCLLRLLLISQNLKCENCQHYFIINSMHRNCFWKLFAFRNMIHFISLFLLVLIFSGIIGIIISFSFEFKYLYVKYITLIAACLLDAFFVFLFVKFIRNVRSNPINEKIFFMEQHANNNNNNNPEPTSLLSKSQDSSSLEFGKKSAQVYSNFLSNHFGVTLNDVTEYLSKKYLNTSFSKHSTLALAMDEFQKWKENEIFLKENFGKKNQNFSKSIIQDILEKNPQIQLNINMNMNGENSPSEKKKQQLKIGQSIDSNSSQTNKIILPGLQVDSSENNKKSLPVVVVSKETTDPVVSTKERKSSYIVQASESCNTDKDTGEQCKNNSNILLLNMNMVDNSLKQEEMKLRYPLKMTKIEEVDSRLIGNDEESPAPRRKGRTPGSRIEIDKACNNPTFMPIQISTSATPNENKFFLKLKSSVESFDIAKIDRNEEINISHKEDNIIVIPNDNTGDHGNISQEMVKLKSDLENLSPIMFKKSITPKNIGNFSTFLLGPLSKEKDIDGSSAPPLVCGNKELFNTQVTRANIKREIETSDDKKLCRALSSDKVDNYGNINNNNHSDINVINNINKFKITSVVINTDGSKSCLVVNCGGKIDLDVEKLIIGNNLKNRK